MIECENVFKSYLAEVPVLAGVSFTVQEKEFAYLVGPSGSGKTTLLKLFYAEEKPTGGSLYINGQALDKLKPGEIPYFRQKVGLMFQDLKLFESRTVWENVSFPLHIQGLSRRQLREQVQNVLSVVEMEKKPDLKVQLLSSAERTRVALARAMVRRPSCLLADEPFASLTKAGAQEVNELFRRANTMGTTVLIATRDQKLAESNGQRVIYLQDGAAHYQDPALAAAQAKEADDAKK